MVDDGNVYLTRRKAEILLEANESARDDRFEAHRREHAQEREALHKALDAERSQQQQHNIAHDKAHDAHEEKHKGEAEAVKTALAAVAREREIHAAAHEREHVAHQREHSLANLAIDKAESATDKRFVSSNAYREQINDMIRTLATRETVETHFKDADRRFEEQRKDIERRRDETQQAIETLQRTDVKAEGRGIGQGAMVAYIVTAVGLVGSVLAIVIVLSNVLATRVP